jgi:hypothetical protein
VVLEVMIIVLKVGVVVLEVARKTKSDVCHLGFGSKWNDKKTMMTSSVFIVVVLDVTTQEKDNKHSTCTKKIRKY